MKVRPEIAELLSGFEKRMKFANIARFLMEYTYKDAVKAMIPDRDLLDNLIMAALVFIKERTLGSEQNCKLEDVADFLDDLSPLLPEGCAIDSAELARFIIIDVLQKGGMLTNYRVLVPEKEGFEAIPLRLVEEERGNYHLTDDAFDFLFRSKEIESELDYSVTRFRMAEYMKRDNYVEALDQSRELVSKIRNMKLSMDDFMRRCRENISKITIDQYENVVSRVRSLLETEYEELRTIQDSARKRADKLAEARLSGVGSEEIDRHRRALAEIIRNIQLTIEEQRSLINKRMFLSDAYQSILSDSYAMNRYERLDFDRDIMAELRGARMPLDLAAMHLLFPLTKPEFENLFSIENFYGLQTTISEIEEEAEAFEEEIEEADPMEIRNARFLAICAAFFSFFKGRTLFKISEFAGSLGDEELYEFCEENALPQVILSLYALQTVSVSDWKNAKEMIVPPMGEFELAFCLAGLPEEYLAVDSFSVRKLEREFSFTVLKEGRQNRICMSDFEVEVKR
ncbi:MAG: hypothetical protein K6E30_10950 [Lachnospiraceae bacterium]|nr:hypothetical protein [Lachnospiraceae bacterium]